MASRDPFGESAEESRPLGSWKEISRYLNCSLRTCQRWEQELDLPIHRLDGTPKARVFAYPEELDRWLKGKLDHSDVLRDRRARPWLRLKKWLAASAVGCFILGAGVFLTSRSIFLPRPFPPEHKPSLAILPFENTSGDDNLDSWETALPDLMITDLAQSRFVNVARITDLYRGLVKLELGDAVRFSDGDLKRIAETIGVGHVTTGSIDRDGPKLIVKVLIKRPGSEEAPRSVRTDLRGESGVFDAADDLTKGIRRALGLARRYISRDIDKGASKVSTGSPQAFSLFSQGYRLVGIGKYQEGIVLLQKAVELDPGFALACKYLWRACMNARREDDAKTYAQKAVERAGRLAERERGDLEVLFYRDYQIDPAREKRALERLWRYHPDDRFGGLQLFELYWNEENWGEALRIAQIGMEANPKNINFYRGLVQCYENSGRGGKAEEVISDFIRANPDHEYLRDALVLRVRCYMLHNKYEAALDDLETLAARYPNQQSSTAVQKGLVYFYQDDLLKAEAAFRERLKSDELRARLDALRLLRDLSLLQGKIEEAKGYLRQGIEMAGQAGSAAKSMLIDDKSVTDHFELAYLYRLAGDPAEALSEIEEAIKGLKSKADPSAGFEARTLHLKALILLDLNRTGEFDSEIDEIKQLVEKEKKPKLMRYCYHLLGQGELEKDNTKKAIDYFWRAIDLLSVPGVELQGADPEFLYSLAEAYESLERGGSIRALSTYERIVHPTVNRLHNGDMYARSFYRMAKFHESASRSGNLKAEEIRTSRSKAVDCYRRFLALWKDADPIFAAEVEDARTRLAALEAEGKVL